jgi:hypothetical protein
MKVDEQQFKGIMSCMDEEVKKRGFSEKNQPSDEQIKDMKNVCIGKVIK